MINKKPVKFRMPGKHRWLMVPIIYRVFFTSQEVVFPGFLPSTVVYPLFFKATGLLHGFRVFKLMESTSQRLEFPGTHLFFGSFRTRKTNIYIYIWVFPKIMVPPNHPF